MWKRIRVSYKFERPSQNSHESVKCDKNKLDCDINCTLSQYAKTILLKKNDFTNSEFKTKNLKSKKFLGGSKDCL